MTRGEHVIGVDFNPSGDPTVTAIKAAAAGLIDLVEAIDDVEGAERGRLKALAVTHIETAAMFAVKAATRRPRPVSEKP